MSWVTNTTYSHAINFLKLLQLNGANRPRIHCTQVNPMAAVHAVPEQGVPVEHAATSNEKGEGRLYLCSIARLERQFNGLVEFDWDSSTAMGGWVGPCEKCSMMLRCSQMHQRSMEPNFPSPQHLPPLTSTHSPCKQAPGPSHQWRPQSRPAASQALRPDRANESAAATAVASIL